MPFSLPFFYPHYYNKYIPHKNSSMMPNKSSFGSCNFSPNSISGVNGNLNYSNASSSSGFSSTNKQSSLPNEENFNDSNVASDVKSNDRDLTDDSECLFEIFGLKLYFDDILILCILFFLYTENVKDNELFLCLVLLLLT